MDNIQAFETRSKFINALTKWGLRFKLPTPPVISMEKDSSDSKVNSHEVYVETFAKCPYVAIDHND
jgi:hypothetical protein